MDFIIRDNVLATIPDCVIITVNEHKETKAVIGYSPGYCGWHLSGQRKIFEYLKPEQIGVHLNDFSLMTPLKSVTGVLIGGRPKIHLFEDRFQYCAFCRERSCQERMLKFKGTFPVVKL